MCGEIDEQVLIGQEMLDRAQRDGDAKLNARPEGPGEANGDRPEGLAEAEGRAAYMERIFRSALARALDDIARAEEDETVDALAAQAIALARVAGFLAGQLPPEADLYRATIEALSAPGHEGAAARSAPSPHHHDDHATRTTITEAGGDAPSLRPCAEFRLPPKPRMAADRPGDGLRPQLLGLLRRSLRLRACCAGRSRAGTWWMRAFIGDLALLAEPSAARDHRALHRRADLGDAAARQGLAALVGAESGLRGLVIATAAGTITPGGPSSSYALLAVLAASGADRGALIAYITAWGTLGVQRILVWDVPFMGPGIRLPALSSSACPCRWSAGLIARRLPMELRVKGAEPRSESRESARHERRAFSILFVLLAGLLAPRRLPAARGFRPGRRSASLEQFADAGAAHALRPGRRRVSSPNSSPSRPSRAMLGDDAGLLGHPRRRRHAGFWCPRAPSSPSPSPPSSPSPARPPPRSITFVTSWSIFAAHRILIYEIPLLGTSFLRLRAGLGPRRPVPRGNPRPSSPVSCPATAVAAADPAMRAPVTLR